MSFTILLRLDQSLSVNGKTDLRTNDRPHRQTLPIKNLANESIILLAGLVES